MKLQNKLEQLGINLEEIKDKKLQETIMVLFNIIEEQATEIQKLREENQKLRDENNKLKGEQGKPNIKANKKPKEDSDISSEKERKGTIPKERNRKTKKDKIEIDRIEICDLDKNLLPTDAKFKGYQNVIIQDLKIETNNIEFKKKIYYSPSENKTYMANLPPCYEGEFGPTIKALTIILKNVCDMTEPKILKFFQNFKIIISSGTISNFLIKDKDQFHSEKEELFKTGLESTEYQNIDDTSSRVKGTNQHTQILCNPFYTAYFTTEKKDRLSILKVLQNTQNLRYCLNEETLNLLEQLRVSKKYRFKLKSLKDDKTIFNRDVSKKELEKFLNQKLCSVPNQVKDKILEASAIAFYHKRQDYPVIRILVCDEAPQFKLLTYMLSLCWIHEGRHYKKLRPVVPSNIKKLDNFIVKFWKFYRKLLEYKSSPSSKLSEILSSEFDKLFSTQTGYKDLDERILKTKSKKDNLLLVLECPELPLHNNEAELGARQQVRKRDISLHTMSEEGTKAKDTFLTIVQTCKKLGINVYLYIHDRIKKDFQLPSLSEVLKTKIQQVNYVVTL
jgi:regulator of replication initiation timing